MNALHSDAERRYLLRVAHFLRDEAPGAAHEDQTRLYAFIREMVRKARTYNLHSEREVATYVLSAYLLGQDFEEKFEGARLVLNSSLPGSDKAIWLRYAAIWLVNFQKEKR